LINNQNDGYVCDPILLYHDTKLFDGMSMLSTNVIEVYTYKLSLIWYFFCYKEMLYDGLIICKHCKMI